MYVCMYVYHTQAALSSEKEQLVRCEDRVTQSKAEISDLESQLALIPGFLGIDYIGMYKD